MNEQTANAATARRFIVEDFVADSNYDWPWLVAPAYPDGVGRTGQP